jgi:uncharacterized protein
VKIGIISDTHDHLPRVRQALEIFQREGVGRVLHAGDLCSPFVLLEFKKLGLPFTAVFGNNDGEWLGLTQLARELGEVHKGPLALPLDGRRIALMHEPVFIDALADSGHFDLIVFGHTHDLEERRTGGTLVVNPGEACGFLRLRATAMVCDLADLRVRTLELD